MSNAKAPDRAIIEAARALFARQGFRRTSLQEIAEAAGVGTGSIAYHVGSKGEVYHAVMERAVAALTRRLELAARSGAPGGRRASEVVRTAVDHLRHRSALPALLLQDVPDTASAAAARAVDRVKETLARHLRAAVDADEGPGAPVAVARRTLASVLGPGPLLRSRHAASPAATLPTPPGAPPDRALAVAPGRGPGRRPGTQGGT